MASLFDGKTLKGWHQVGDGQWVVEDGAIVGKTATAAKLYGLLVSDKKYKNLNVRFKFKSIKGNSGFYIRGTSRSRTGPTACRSRSIPQQHRRHLRELRRAWISQPSAELVKSTTSSTSGTRCSSRPTAATSS